MINMVRHLLLILEGEQRAASCCTKIRAADNPRLGFLANDNQERNLSAQLAFSFVPGLREATTIPTGVESFGDVTSLPGCGPL
jgi:hypothetical protein